MVKVGKMGCQATQAHALPPGANDVPRRELVEAPTSNLKLGFVHGAKGCQVVMMFVDAVKENKISPSGSLGNTEVCFVINSGQTRLIMDGKCSGKEGNDFQVVAETVAV